jgi:hypothetical protein
MTNIADIEKAVEQLSPEDLAKFRAWFESYRTDDGFSEQPVRSWDKFEEIIAEQAEGKMRSVYRGEPQRYGLSSSLERVLRRWSITRREQTQKIERQLLRDFLRRYDGGDSERVQNDILLALSVMRHFGAPTRLLDFTYSPYVAARMALNSDSTGQQGRIWCFNEVWCDAAAGEIVGADLIGARNEVRNDGTFKPLYMCEQSRKFVKLDNPFELNRRLQIQQGLFLIPGDIGSSFVDNVKAMNGWNSRGNILRLRLELGDQDPRDFALRLLRMNVDSAALFPGLDGACKSLGERIPLLIQQQD